MAPTRLTRVAAAAVSVLLLTVATACSAADDVGRAGVRVVEQRAAQEAARHATTEAKALSRARTVLGPYGAYADDENTFRRFLSDACTGSDVIEEGGSLALGEWVKRQWPTDVDYGSDVADLAVDLANQSQTSDTAAQAAVGMICG